MRAFIVLLICLALLTACQGYTPPPPPTAAPTPTVTPTARVWPTAAPDEPEMPIFPETTATPRPTISPTRPAPAIYGAPPEGNPGDYALKPWDSTQAWELAHASDAPSFPEREDGWAYNYTDWDAVQRTLLREVAYRVPESPHAGDAALELSTPYYPSAISLPAHDTVEPFRKALELALNADPNFRVTEESLGAAIAAILEWDTPYPLEILPADNVLGNGAPGWVFDFQVYQVSTAFALSGQPGAYQLVSAFPEWRELLRSGQSAAVQDLNANGIPEIELVLEQWGSGMSNFCDNYYDLYEWDGTRFRNLTPNVSTFANQDLGDCLPFETLPGPNGTQAISTGYTVNVSCTIEETRNAAGSLIVQEIYEWDGKVYEIAHRDVLPLEASMPEGQALNRCTLSWVSEAGPANDQAFQLLPDLLAQTDEALLAGWAEQWGPAYEDYFRFKLGTWYAMRGQRAEAVALLTQVRHRPANPEFETASQMASAFLTAYDSTGTYAGCAAASRLIEWEQFVSAWGGHNTPEMKAAYGFADPLWAVGTSAFFSGMPRRTDIYNICSLPTALQLSIRGRLFPATSDLTGWLEAQQIPYTGLETGDLDGDGASDYLIQLGTGTDQAFDLWALMNTQQGIQPVRIGRSTRQWQIPTAWASFEPAPGAGLYNVYVFPKGAIFFKVSTAADEILITPVADRVPYTYYEDILAFTINPGATGETVRLELTNDLWREYGWLPQEQTVGLVDARDLEQNRKVFEIEKWLFEDQDPAPAIAALEEMLTGYNRIFDLSQEHNGRLPRVRPYLQYLLGLAYEMNGDENKAVEAYWNLWDEHPLHPLSYIVQQKLELKAQ